MIGGMDDERFWARVIKNDDGCWEWSGARHKAGYGRLRRGFQEWLAHRYAWFLTTGEVPPKGTDLDHLCRNPPCVRPDHLEAVTHRENNRRGDVANRRKTHCAKGHPFSPENTIWASVRGEVRQRVCRICRRAYIRSLRARKAAAEPEWVEHRRELQRAAWARRIQDPDFRAAENARTLAAYYRRKGGG